MTLTPGAIQSIETVAFVAGLAYAALAAYRNRLCWVAGGVSSAALAFAAGVRALPMQAGLQVIFVGMAVYGWWSWTRSSANSELPMGTSPWQTHLAAAVVLVGVSFASAPLLARETNAAWPLLDSLTTWFSLFATWLQSRAKIENWIYWIVIDVVLVYLFYVQGLKLVALLNVLYVGIAAVGFISWRRQLSVQARPRAVAT